MIQLNHIARNPYAQSAAILAVGVAFKASESFQAILANTLGYFIGPFAIRHGYNQISQGGARNVLKGAYVCTGGAVWIAGTVGLNVMSIQNLMQQSGKEDKNARALEFEKLFVSAENNYQNCMEPISKDAFYNKNICNFYYDRVLAKMENVVGQEEQQMVVCSEKLKTNSTQPPSPDAGFVLRRIFEQQNYCYDQFLRPVFKGGPRLAP